MKTFTAKSYDLEDAYEQCCEALKATKDQLKFEVKEEKELTSTTYVVNATLTIDYPMLGLEYLKSILEGLGINAMVEMRKKHNKEIRYVITSEENPLLIGKGGKTLEAIETLVKLVVSPSESNEEYVVSVDCGGYKQQRIKQLEIIATKTAKEVAQTKVAASLDPMNSYERRVIHEKLASWNDITTESEGSGKNRHVVIKPSKKEE